MSVRAFLVPIPVTLNHYSASWPGLSRPSTSFSLTAGHKDVDARDNRRIKSGDGHDGEEAIPSRSNAL
jgi:hypothetical protein